MLAEVVTHESSFTDIKEIAHWHDFIKGSHIVTDIVPGDVLKHVILSN